MEFTEPRKLNPLLMVLLGAPVLIAIVPLTSIALSFMVSHGHHELPTLDFPGWMVIPFALLLGAIAATPFMPHKLLHWWEDNTNRLKVAVALAIPVVIYMYLYFDAPTATATIWHSLKEYISFVVLLFTLYTISGGIHLQGNLVGSPVVNLIFLTIGTLLASIVGTTGASMLLIRPLLSTNRERKHTTHIYVFFIFLVSNIGGSLTPLGDPPLFLGFLRGVPFFWTLKLFPAFALASVILLALFFVIDTIMYAKEDEAAKKLDEADYVPLRILGGFHALFLIGAIALIILTPKVEHMLHGPHGGYELWWLRDAGMMALALISLGAGEREIRYKKNGFNFHAMGEVAALFLGIFICMIPALSILKINGKAGNIPVKEPAHFMWATGICSGFLDNAPTYLVYVSVAQGVLDQQEEEAETKLSQPLQINGELHPFSKEHLHLPEQFLLAISIGAVFFGALTYIGNAPNFMVNAICVGNGVKMPTFFGYLKWSVPILGTVYVITHLVFFPGLPRPQVQLQKLPAKAAKGLLTVSGKVLTADGQPAKAHVKVRADGAKGEHQHHLGDADTGPDGTFTVQLPIKAGDNVIRVSAREEGGNLSEPVEHKLKVE